MSAPTKRTRKRNGIIVGHSGKPINLEQVNAVRDDPPPPTVVRPKWQREYESGFVVRARLHAPGWFTSPDRSRGRGIIIEASPDLQRAHWFKAGERELAEQTAAWQMGFVKLARRDTDTGIIEEVVT